MSKTSEVNDHIGYHYCGNSYLKSKDKEYLLKYFINFIQVFRMKCFDNSFISIKWL